MLLAVALLATGCWDTQAEQEGEATIRIYERNRAVSADPLYSLIEDGSSGHYWTRIESGASWCLGVYEPWTIQVGSGSPDGPEGELTPLLSSADVANSLDAEISIDVAPDGSVSWREGRPDWAGGSAPHCALE